MNPPQTDEKPFFDRCKEIDAVIKFSERPPAPTQWGWVGFDLDCSLAKHDVGGSIEDIGEPIQVMVDLVRGYLARGYEVRVLTARVARTGHRNPAGVADDDAFADAQEKMIGDWTEIHIGQRLRATATKDFQMLCLFDDRAIAVQPNTGLILGGNPI